MMLLFFPPQKFAWPSVGIDRTMLGVCSGMTFMPSFTGIALLVCIILWPHSVSGWMDECTCARLHTHTYTQVG
jgi:hypothetical protein